MRSESLSEFAQCGRCGRCDLCSQCGRYGHIYCPFMHETGENRISYQNLDQDLAKSGTGSGLAGSRSGKIWIWIRFGRIEIWQYPDLDMA